MVKARQRAGRRLDEVNQNSVELTTGETTEHIGKLADVSRDTVARVKKLNAKADEEKKRKRLRI